MQVFLTGGSGFVGSYAAAALLEQGHELRLLVRSLDKAARVLGGRGIDVDDPRLTLVQGDMVDATAIAEAIEGCDATIHTAAAIGVTSGGQLSVMEQNTTGARLVTTAALAARHDPIIHVSSISVFVPPSAPVITVDSPLASPRAEYGRSKVVTERELRALQSEGAPITILYPGGVLGPDQPTLDAALEGIVGARSQGWPMTPGGVSFVDVRDIAAVLTRLVEPRQGPRRLMLGGSFLTWAELGAAIDGLTGVRARRVWLPKPLLYGMGSFLDRVRRVRPIAYPLTRDAAEMMATCVPTDDTATLQQLGVTLRPVRESLEDTLRWLVASGHLDPRHAGRLALA